MQAKHIFVTGSSGGGKTTYLRELHATSKAASIFLTTKTRESNVSGVSVSGKRALHSAVQQASTPGECRAKWLGASYPQSATVAREWAIAVREQKGWPAQIIVDECQNAPEMTSESRGPIRSGLHEDRSRGIKWCVATQDPQDLRPAYSSIKQCKYIVWCGPPNSFHKGFLTYYNLDPKQLPEQPYHFHVIEPTLPPEIAYKGETNPTYS